MPDYKITITKTAQKQLDKLSDKIAEPIIDAIQNLAQNPLPQGCKKLKGRDAYRIRRGNYRIIYDIYDNILTIDIVAIGHRKDVYR
jgi:mRNA interferase RelE/StbE